MTQPTSNTVEQPFSLVKSPINSQLPLFPNSMTPHSNFHIYSIRGNIDKVRRLTSYYGVSYDHRVLTKGVFLKQFDRVRDFLKYVLGFSVGERDFTLGLLEYWAYYGKCYPKIADLTHKPGCSESTAHRALRKLKDLGLARVIERYLEPRRRQISNLLLLHKLLILIARYLAEHGVAFYEKWLKPYLTMPGREFWSQIFLAPGDRAGPLIPA
uniref:Putative DNA binding, helix-turn-helix domain containing protein n=1 Tax=viral metagenome TaxID=1070528 RepID=A0A6M3LV62_9ZZZZ